MYISWIKQFLIIPEPTLHVVVAAKECAENDAESELKALKGGAQSSTNVMLDLLRMGYSSRGAIHMQGKNFVVVVCADIAPV